MSDVLRRIWGPMGPRTPRRQKINIANVSIVTDNFPDLPVSKSVALALPSNSFGASAGRPTAFHGSAFVDVRSYLIGLNMYGQRQELLMSQWFLPTLRLRQQFFFIYLTISNIMKNFCDASGKVFAHNFRPNIKFLDSMKSSNFS